MNPSLYWALGPQERNGEPPVGILVTEIVVPEYVGGETGTLPSLDFLLCLSSSLHWPLRSGIAEPRFLLGVSCGCGTRSIALVQRGKVRWAGGGVTGDLRCRDWDDSTQLTARACPDLLT